MTPTRHVFPILFFLSLALPLVSGIAWADVYAGVPPLVCRTKADFKLLDKKTTDQQNLISSGRCWRLDKDWQASILEWKDFASQNLSRWKIKGADGAPITVWGPVLGDS